MTNFDQNKNKIQSKRVNMCPDQFMNNYYNVDYYCSHNDNKRVLERKERPNERDYHAPQPK